MKLIELQGKHGSIAGRYAQVSDSDYEHLNQWKWICVHKSKNYYAVRAVYNKNKCRNVLVYMHRQLLEVTITKLCVDHIDHNGLNNQRENIRIVTNSQNQANSNPHEGKPYKGIRKLKNGIYVYWMARCMKDGVRTQGKCRKTIEEAINDYNIMAKKLHGEYAKINI